MVVYSAYWPVDNNPKQSAKKHLSELQKKNVDILFTDVKRDIAPTEIICSPPAHELVNDFIRSPCHLKFGIEVTPETMTKLSRIWCSKILLSKEIDDDAVWVDCVSAKNFDMIKSKTKDRITINRYTRMYKDPFRLGNTPFRNLKIQLLGQVIGIPKTISIEASECFCETLMWVKNNYPVYDEEVVLSHMYETYPDMFKVV
jgi:hypothetical protein